MEDRDPKPPEFPPNRRETEDDGAVSAGLVLFGILLLFLVRCSPDR